jgi:fructose-1,6-bisphosphatase/inositol monophosphatase family enzyme/glutathione synthase/RimK-type ligase-like ATP-grasp enzyme
MSAPPRIAMLLVKHPPERKSPIVPEVIRRLQARGARVEVIYPDESVTDLASVRVAHDLYVLKSGTERALSLAGALHAQGARIVNPYPVAAALRDKVVSTRILQAAGAPVPETWLASRPQELAPLLQGGGLVLKPYRGSQGRGIRVVRTPEELAAADASEPLVFAQRLHPADGPDHKLYGVGGRVFGVRRCWPPRSYEDKLGEPFEVSPELAEVAARCGRAFGVSIFGVDVVLSQGRPLVVDMQCFPGFKGVPDAAALLADAIHQEAVGAAAPEALPLGRELEVATGLARQAGAVLRRHRAGRLEVRHKANGEVVTAADLEANALVREGLEAAFPGDAVFSEETADSAARLSCRRVWIVDPLDATSNYTEGGDEYCVSIGLAQEGRPVLGVVYNPARDELVAGGEGLGVQLNGARVRATDPAGLEGARLLVSRKEWRRGLDGRAAALPAVPMASMAYKLARVAAGMSDGAFSLTPRKEWGTCAGVALVKAAGGRATLVDDTEIRFNRPEPRQPLGMLAAGPGLHAALLRALGPPAASGVPDSGSRPGGAGIVFTE